MKKLLLVFLFTFGGGLHLLLAILMIINVDYLFALLPTFAAAFSFTYCTTTLKKELREDEEDADI